MTNTEVYVIFIIALIYLGGSMYTLKELPNDWVAQLYSYLLLIASILFILCGIYELIGPSP